MLTDCRVTTPDPEGHEGRSCPFLFCGCQTVLYWSCLDKATLKKSLFSVQRVAILVASREAAKSFFFFVVVVLCIEMVRKMLRKGKKK